jgi:hypothetical protein
MNTPAIVLGIIIVVLFFILYFYFTSSSKTNSVAVMNLNTSSSTPLIESKNVKNSKSTQFAYGIWVYVNSWDSSKEKIIFYRPNSTTASTKDISVYLDKSSPKLYCSIKTDSTTTTDAPILITNNFPLQKWMCITVSVSSQFVDTYLNGKLVTSQQLYGVPTVSDTPIYTGAFDAYAAQFQRWPNALDPQTVWTTYLAGNGGNSFSKMFNSYGLDISFTQNGITQGTVSV